MSFYDLISTMKHERLRVDKDLLRLAYETAERAHAGQVRLSGEPYVTHSLAVANTLARLRLDEETIIAGLLHDVPEDTHVTINELRKDFGDTVANLVDGVTKLGKLKYRGMERYVENLRKMFVAMAQDIRVILIKFADRLHNLETLDFLPSPEKRRRIALESIEIYAPIANRLGMGEIKGQLEDLSFPYVFPEEQKATERMLSQRLGDITGYLEDLKTTLHAELRRHRIRVVDIHGRQKHLYSLYKKLQRPGIDGDIMKIYDLVAIRIIVGSVEDCYAALGIIHGKWRPLPGRIKDYIAQPKPNGYQSIHTTVFGPNGQIIEIQIRDTKMHDDAEYGIAAHWHYVETGKQKKVHVAFNQKLAWVRELNEWQKELENEQYLEALRIDVFSNRIFCFTPRGDVIDLPENATAIDFAFAVHSELGCQITGARINGKFEQVTVTLKSGDVVEILTDKNRTSPNPDWLPYVKTSLARDKIRKAQRDEQERSRGEPKVP
ncbi:MAG: RelA/SpoT family protein [Candidatus Kerfeldbacteria bacterium]